ncbi:DUF3168 domain-containing protein [Rossellomorea aquimaris]|uniref:DUF3168 domain-containing protein n=1 Tax=Rossellomorea aquimaris TaxID=189382 RepID=UPI001CD35203|nr:DUF3168 domain-containing protein [Rossellomorea aquimaris]MCA1058117.1 DUF3168 domain-containing protein [Rossellomorea aquimaris]
MIYKIYNALLADPVINTMVNGRIKFYEYPASGDVTGPYIIIDPLSPPLAGDFADNKWLTDSYLFQIEVWSKSLEDTTTCAKQVRNVMWKILGFSELSTGVDEYDSDLSIYRVARRYKGKEYVE